MMLGFLNATARFLQPARPLFGVLLVGSIVGFGVAILGVLGESDSYAIVFLVLCLWSLSLLLVVMCFPRQATEILSGDGFWLRLRKRIDRIFTLSVAVVTVLVNLAVIFTTFRLAGILLNGAID